MPCAAERPGSVAGPAARTQTLNSRHAGPVNCIRSLGAITFDAPFFCTKLPGIARRRIYDTTPAGRGNGGHPFGDELTGDERWAMIEDTRDTR